MQLSWLKQPQKLVKAFQALEVTGKTAETINAVNSARNLNNVVSGANVIVDSYGAVDTCSQAGVLTGSCGGALAALGADIVFGTVDYKQGQLGFGDPLKKVSLNEPVPIRPLDVKNPNDTRIATAAEIEQINQLIENPFGAVPGLTNIDGETRFIPPAQLSMLDQLSKDPIANTSTVVNNGTQLLLPKKVAAEDPNTNFNLTKADSNETSALAIFSPTNVTPDGGVVAQLLPSNLNSQIPNTPPHAETNLANAPNVDLTAPKPGDPNLNNTNDVAKPLTGTEITDTVNSPATVDQPSTIASWFDENVVKPVSNTLFGNPVPKTLDAKLSSFTNQEIDGVISKSTKYVDDKTAQEVTDYFNKNYYSGNTEFKNYTSGLHADVYQFKYNGVDYVIKIPTGPSDVATNYRDATINGQRLIAKQGLSDNLAPTTFVSSPDGRPIAIQKFVEGNTFLFTNSPNAIETIDLFKQHGLGIADPKIQYCLYHRWPIIIDQEGAFLIDNAIKRIAKNPEVAPMFKIWTDGYTPVPVELTGLAKAWDQTKNIINNIPETGGAINIIKKLIKLETK
jgi:hypothetical protein